MIEDRVMPVATGLVAFFSRRPWRREVRVALMSCSWQDASMSLSLMNPYTPADRSRLEGFAVEGSMSDRSARLALQG